MKARPLEVGGGVVFAGFAAGLVGRMTAQGRAERTAGGTKPPAHCSLIPRCWR
jgi:hypothetical protein